MSEPDLVYDAARGAAALDRVSAQIASVPEERLQLLNFDPQAGALVVLRVAAFCAQADVRARFALLPAEMFDIRVLDTLPDFAWAAWHVRIEQIKADTTRTGAMLPADLVSRSTARKASMLDVVGYYLGDDPDQAAEVAAIRAGTGYMDLATDLVRLSALYKANRTILAPDTKAYRAEDEVAAAADSAEIMKHLRAREGEAARWADTQARVWALLLPAYEEVRDAGRFLFRKDSRKDRFPSLVGAARRRARSTSASTTPTEPTADGSTPTA